MRIAYVAASRLPTENAYGLQIARMCEAFARAGHEVLLWHPRRRQPAPALEREDVVSYYAISERVAVRAFASPDAGRLRRVLASPAGPAVATAQTWAFARLVAREARREGADLWYTRDPIVAGALARAGLPTALELHAVPRRAARRALARLSREPSLRRVIALTGAMADDTAALGFDRGRIVVLPDAADVGAFAAAPTRVEARRRLGLPPDASIVGYLGRFRTLGREKGLPELVEAMGLVGDRALLVAVGGPMEVVPAYLERASAAGVAPDRLRFVDRVGVAEVPVWLAAFDVAVLPMPDEPHFARHASPLKLFEYLAAGLPIVASDLPSVREVVRHGDAAWLVRPGDPPALAEGIGRLLADAELRARLGTRAREVARLHTWDARAAAALEAIE
jgi:glycosyltransferase involved in cell wall biosynthesis